jgi:hypothetical protein
MEWISLKRSQLDIYCLNLISIKLFMIKSWQGASDLKKHDFYGIIITGLGEAVISKMYLRRA